MRIEKLYLKDVGPFGEQTIVFPEKKDPKKAEIHIFTGENGSGKSTILYALAAGFGATAETLLLKRFRSSDSVCMCDTDLETRSMFTQSSRDFPPNGNLPRNPKTCISRVESTPELDRHLALHNQYVRLNDSVEKMDVPLDGPSNFMLDAFLDQTLQFALFAYSGSRSLRSVSLLGIQEIKTHPLKSSLSFYNTCDPVIFAQWLANTKAQAALAAAEGDMKRSKSRHDSIRRIESAAGKITNHKFQFVMDSKTMQISSKLDGQALELEVLPDGLKSIISWIGDLLMRMDRLKWESEVNVLDRNFILFLDEIEIHLHPAWQRKILPVIQELFPNAQIFVSTHSPFVVGSVKDAWVHAIELNNGEAKVLPPVESMAGISIMAISSEIFRAPEFDIETEKSIKRFYALKNDVLKGRNGSQKKQLSELKKLSLKLAKRGLEVRDIVAFEMNQMNRQLGKPNAAQ